VHSVQAVHSIHTNDTALDTALDLSNGAARTRLGEQQRDFAEQVAFFQNRERLRSSSSKASQLRADVNTAAHAVRRRRTSTLASLGLSRGSTVAWRTGAASKVVVVSVTFACAAQEVRR
jgi:hypothetical protein